MTFRIRTVILVALLAIAARGFSAEQRFTEHVGNVSVGTVDVRNAIQVPFITWGGDMVTFHANGGARTRADSVFARQGLDLRLAQGDDFVQQVRDYIAGKSPLLRGTVSQVALAAEAINADPRTQGVCILQLTWSAGDHMVARGEIKTVRDLKGKTIVLQYGGPHVGFLDDVLKTAQLSWDDVHVVWAKDLSGTTDSPAEILRKRSDVAACFVITPDMIGLCGGLGKAGSGAEGTVKNARVLVSTAQMSHSIADVYVCRKDFYEAQPDWVQKFAAGYFIGSEQVLALKKKFDGKGPAEYVAVLKLAQDIYGKKALPSLEEDAHGLLSDCTLAGYPGNVSFFTDSASLHNFDVTQNAALDVVTRRGFARTRCRLLSPAFDYNAPIFKTSLTNTAVVRQDKFRAEAVQKEIEELTSSGGLNDRTIVSFTINFEPNQSDFNISEYAREYQRVVQLADKYGNAVIAVRGHSDPTKTLVEFVKAGMAKNILSRSGANGSYAYAYQGKPLTLDSTNSLIGLIDSGAFDGVAEHNPRENLQAALNLSRKRADAVRDSIVDYAQRNGLRLDKSQIQPVGAGIREPFIAKPANMDQAKQNMRVEFRLIRVEAESASSGDFDL